MARCLPKLSCRNHLEGKINMFCSGFKPSRAWSCSYRRVSFLLLLDYPAVREMSPKKKERVPRVEKHPVKLFSRMRSKGSRFTLGVWGLRVCSLDVAFASATVRNRWQPFAWGPYGRAYGKFYRGGPFWRFQTSGCFVSRGRRGTSWHSDVFCNVSKVVLRGRRNTFATFAEDVLQFSWQGQHFGRVHRHFSWQAQHFRRVVLRVFCKSHWQGCVKWRQGANSVAVVAFSAMCWKLTEASHETSILRLQIFRF